MLPGNLIMLLRIAFFPRWYVACSFFCKANFLMLLLFSYFVIRTLVTCPAGDYIFKVNNRNTKTRCEICSKLTIKTPERRQWWRRSGVFKWWLRSCVFIVSFEHISHLFLVFLLLVSGSKVRAESSKSPVEIKRWCLYC